MRFPLSGVRVPHRKNTQDMAAVRMPAPDLVTIPMAMHIGKPAIPTVKVGDEVFVGTLIADRDGVISAPIYSSVSGRVKALGELMLPHGVKTKTVVIESDGAMTLDPGISAPEINSRADLIEAIKDSGTVGLGGAGFPSYVKFDVPDGRHVSELIINGAECEPYITSDTRTMIDKTDDILFGITSILKYISIEKVIIGIENNKKTAIAAMRKMAEADSRIEVRVLKSIYPQGGEKVLVYHTTGKVIPAGKLPLDVGVIVCNCTTVAAIGNYIKTGIPLISKCVTVDGGAVASPKNVIAPIGASLRDVFEFAGCFSEPAGKVLLGGPMMGHTVASLDMPIMKSTNAILAFTEREAERKRETACIRCGACAAHCPVRLNPAAFMRAYKTENIDELQRLRIDICMECGCCSYICPAGQPLVEINKLSKAKVKEYLAEKKKREETNDGK